MVVEMVGLSEFGGHGAVVVEVGEGGVGIFGAGVEDALGGSRDGVSLRVRRLRPREVVIDDVLAVAIVALEPSADHTRPRVVDDGGQNAEMIQSRVRDEKQQVAAQRIRRHHSHSAHTDLGAGRPRDSAAQNADRNTNLSVRRFGAHKPRGGTPARLGDDASPQAMHSGRSSLTWQRQP